MKIFLLRVCTLLSVSLVGSHAVTPEVYWKSVLPDSPMPKSIKDLLYTEWNDEKSTAGKSSVGVHTYKGKSFYFDPRKNDIFIGYHNAASDNQLKDNPNAALFFHDSDLHQGTEMNIHFTKNVQKSTLLPRKIADSIPFSSTKLPQIYNELSVKPDSMEAEIIKQTLNDCESTGNEGEDKYCATSLESMIDFSITKLGKNVKAMTTEVFIKESTPLQKYKIEVAKKFANEAVVCHKQNYAYTVFYCHKTAGTQTYSVSMIGADGTKVNAVAVCHTDTAKWNPKQLAFQVLKEKPGTVPICHFLPEDHVVWVPY